MTSPAAPVDRALALALSHRVRVTDPELVELSRLYPNCAEGMQYARDIAMRDAPACLWVQLACERHIRDLYRLETRPEYPWQLDLYQAERMLNAVQMFKHVKGQLAGKLLVLEPWQKFWIGSLFWWVSKSTGFRRFRLALIAVARGNGKSSVIAALALAMLALDGEGGAEIYAAAVTREQARIVFDCAKQMVENDREFRSRFGVAVTARSIVQEGTASIFRPLSRDARSLDGLNVHFAVCDEVAQHRTRDVWDVLLTAMGKRAQPLMCGITTAGSNQAGIGYELWTYSQRVLKMERDDETFFAIIYCADEGDDWRDPDSWRKANPNWGVSVMPEQLESLCKRAESIAAQQAAFMQKHLNLWTGAGTQWLNMVEWRACLDPNINWGLFKPDPAVLGLDMATKLDLTALVSVNTQHIDGEAHYYVRAWAFIPRDTASRSPVAQYATWAEEGWLIITPGGTTDYEAVEDVIVDWASQTNVVDLGFDPWQSLNLCKKLEREHEIPVIEVRPTVQNFSPAMREIEALVREKRIHHDGNPMLEWCLQNVEVFEDRKENIYPRKATPSDEACKIDLAVALITAMARLMALDAKGAIDITAMIF